MAQQTNAGGSNATDFQPTTTNPQGNVGGGLQPNSANLQPVSNSSGSNAFNQPGINPQAFPQTSSLRVLNSNSQALSSGSAEGPAVNSNSTGWGAFVLIFVAAVSVVAVVLIIVRIIRRSKRLEHVGPEQQLEPASAPNPELEPEAEPDLSSEVDTEQEETEPANILPAAASLPTPKRKKKQSTNRRKKRSGKKKKRK